MELTHASFFSGVGGLDLGLERAGWRTVSFSEIDPYASTVLAERWPRVPNLGDIVQVARGSDDAPSHGRDDRAAVSESDDGSWTDATLWSGGFPCQDLSVAGKRRGMGTEDDRTRSGLAYAFLDLVERHRPPAILLENVPGLLSSHGGKDLGALLGRLGELGYWWAYRILDAQFFGVPQRRRRVFICALHAGAGFGADSAAAVLSVGARCDGHSAAGDEAGEGVASRPGYGIAHALSASHTRSGRYDPNGETYAVSPALTASEPGSGRDLETNGHLLVSPSSDSGGVREVDGLAGRVDDRSHGLSTQHGVTEDGTGRGVPIIAATLNSVGNDGGFRTEPGAHLVALDPTQERDAAGLESDVDTLLPLGLDSHRYRCCGNGVVAPVSEWIGWRLRWAVEGMRAA